MGIMEDMLGNRFYKVTTPSGGTLKGGPYADNETAIQAAEAYIKDHAVGYGTFYIGIFDSGGNATAAVQYDKVQHTDNQGNKRDDSWETGSTGDRGGGAAGSDGLQGDTQDDAVTKGLEGKAKEETPWGLIIVAIIIIAVIIGGVMLWRKG